MMENKKIVKLESVKVRERRRVPDRRAGHGKLHTLESLAEKADALRRAGRHVVLCHGTFDLLHIGHIRHLQRARQEGDTLFVTVTGDAYVNKGPGRPVFTHELRAENLAALECVDAVAVNQAAAAVNVLDLIKPDVYVKGADYQHADADVTGNIARERATVERHGGRILFTQEITSSSTHLLNEHFRVFPAQVRTFLGEFKSRFTDPQVSTALQSLANINVLVVGDGIVDEYHYTNFLGQTGKGNVLAVRYRDAERFAGGSIAVANHLGGFATKVTLLCALGGQESHEKFIRLKLRSNVVPVFFTNPDARTLVKRRYVGDDMAKLFEVYYGEEEITTPELNKKICEWLKRNLARYDAVIVPDFGNGFISNDMVQLLSAKARFLAVNTQMNSGNRGFHQVTRYPRADFVALNEPELRLATNDRSGDLSALGTSVAQRLNATHLAVTRGTQGALMLDIKAQAEHAIPALSTVVVDRIGAGDAFLSLAGLSLAGGLDTELAGFFGSVAAALDVQIVCNREPIDPVGMYKYINTLMK